MFRFVQSIFNMPKHTNTFHISQHIYRTYATNSRKLQYISDIHLEHRERFPMISKGGDYLALLGDIGNPYHKLYDDFIRYTSKFWNKIFIITGNHEYWQKGIPINRVNEQIQNIVCKYDNVHFLNNQEYVLDEYLVLGGTLWTKIEEQPNYLIGDDTQIGLSYQEFNQMHTKTVQWIQDKIKNTNKSVIVLTHHLPSPLMVDDKFKVGRYLKYGNRFSSDLEDIIKPPIKYWLCGHSHSIIEKNINGVQCCINAYGYPNEGDTKREFKPKFVTL